jgi:hypothetical protein
MSLEEKQEIVEKMIEEVRERIKYDWMAINYL